MELNFSNILKFFNDEINDLKEIKEPFVSYESFELLDIFELNKDIVNNKQELYNFYKKLVFIGTANKIPFCINGKIYDPNNDVEGYLELDYGDLEEWLLGKDTFKHPLTEEYLDVLNSDYKLFLNLYIFKV